VNTDAEVLRARRELKAELDEAKAMNAATRTNAVGQLVTGLRARLGTAFTPAAEKRIVELLKKRGG
jgi:hypothetical protein